MKSATRSTGNRIKQPAADRTASALKQREAPAHHGSRRHPEKSRAAILRAAVNEFAEHGIAGARTDAIARVARVNKALLYYYFKDKDALYEAALDHVFSGLRDRLMPVLESSLEPRDKLLAYVGRYFDYIAANPRFPRVVQAEWMRVGPKGSPRMLRIAQEYFAPIYKRVAEMLREGAEKGQFRAVNPMDFLPSIVGVIIFYFSSAPAMKTLLKIDPLSKERIEERRKFVLEFISAALLTNTISGSPEASLV
ncbi:MAG TPA: TetR/AcrR family transcriptional regulator [Terriglobales bacterium]|nr:TetR/AcrR family transcriptional regulator [Terriglobales bacterium]